MTLRIEQTRPDVSAALGRLKGFQRSTVEYAFERLYRAPDSTRRFLVADEVGLGKTLVARGVIAKAIDELWESVDRIDVVYICSNAQIAAQNIQRLQVGGSAFVHADRLTLLPTVIRDLRQNKVNLLAFTPATSLEHKSSLGDWRERALLYHLVQLVWPSEGAGPKNLFQGGVTDRQDWRRRLSAFAEDEHIDRALARAFKRRLREVGKGPRWGGEGLRKRYLDLCERFGRFRDSYPDEDRWGRNAFIGRLRVLLAETCVEALEPDLVILDEFQRFKDILDGDDDAAEMAKRLFTFSNHEADVRLLLLSATPYKMYTLHQEKDEDDHYKDFLRTVEFLDPHLKETGRFRKLLDDYRVALYQIESGTEALQGVNEKIEAELRRVMSRTDRLKAAEDASGMLREVPSRGVELRPAEVRTFLALQEIGREVDQPQVLEYWKSAPYLLSFMDDYKLKWEVTRRLGRASGRRLTELISSDAFIALPWSDVEEYRTLDPANARLRALLEWVEETRLWELLWLPPSLPYYSPRGAWQHAAEAGATKRLVFSTWNVVPKAVACLVSYEIERRIFRRFEAAPRNTLEERKKRSPLLRFASTDGRLTGMPVLGLLYPSPALAALGDPARDGTPQADLGEVVSRVREQVQPILDRLTLRYQGSEGERQDEAWYWAAPILMDLERDGALTREWFADPNLAAVWSGAESKEEEDSRWGDHVTAAKQVIEPTLELGRPPDDLADVVAGLAVAGPAVCALRALTRGSDVGARTDLRAQDRAGQIAWGFRTLLNQPEAMALIRGARQGDETPYWRQALDYCAEGHLQAVLDEYVHTLRDLEGLFDVEDEEAWEKLAEAILGALSLRTVTRSVDDIRCEDGSARVEKRRLRNHFAIRFGDQESDDGKAGAREDLVRTAFNSPFWPFVLTSTSVGQEGLDFHAYCHAVVHWNLPANPVDLEQREGRVQRYKGHAVRKNVAHVFGRDASGIGSEDVWNALFEIARQHAPTDHGLVPYWLFPTPGGAQIERHVPALPLSRDAYQLEALKRSLAVYRMVFGQPRQDDLMAFLLDRFPPDELSEITSLLQIDLSPPA